MKKRLIFSSALLLTTSLFSNNITLTQFDKEMIETQRKMIASSNSFTINHINIAQKKKIDERWTQYLFNVDLTIKRNNQPYKAPLLIFTDGKYQTNSLMDLKTGIKLEIDIKQKIKQKQKAKKQALREKFEKSFKLDKKYYNKEHLIAGNINAKNKVILISDPLCVACINEFPKVYDKINNSKDFALFYYHFPLKRLHPTAETIAKAIEKAKIDGIKNPIARVLKANFMKSFDVYKEKDNKVALDTFNKLFSTNYTLDDLKNISIDSDMKLGSEVQLTGTPTVIYNGRLYNSRKDLYKDLNKLPAKSAK